MTWRIIGGALAGIVASSVAVELCEVVTVMIAPPPPGTDFNDPKSLAVFMAGVPAWVMWLVAIGHAMGMLAGGTLAGRIGVRRATIATSVGFLLVCVVNLLSLPHPHWFWPVDLGLVLAMIPVALRLTRRWS